MSGSVGVAVSEHGVETPEELLRDADAAMYRAKELGGACYELFNAALRDRLMERMEIEADLRHALERDQLVLHYQPLIALDDERLIGFEALLRWEHPERGTVQPDQFISIAEETGLIMPFGSWVLSTVCQQLAEWPESIHVSANVSPMQVKPQLVDEVEALIARHGITPGRLVLEITESLVLDPHTKPDRDQAPRVGCPARAGRLRHRLLVSGQSPALPARRPQARPGADQLHGRDSGSAVVRAAIELGQALGVSVVAEGIEGRVQLSALRELGCGVGQGFLFARPMPVAAGRVAGSTPSDAEP